MLNNKIFLWVKQNIFELIAFILFCAITACISFFHECWFDELQALGIAEDSLYNVIFVIPHLEGHSPLWYLILKVFTFFTSNPDIILKVTNLSIMYCAIWLLVFKSPFPKAVRCTLPFTYFLLYQYTIISRPYSLLILALFCAAVFYKDRDIHPFRFITPLAILALSCGYGMAMCCFICIEWGINIVFFQKMNIKTFLLKDKRFFGMLFLFIFCLVLSILILPYKDTQYFTGLLMLPKWQRALYFAFGATADSAVTNIYNYTNRSINNLIFAYNIASMIMGFLLLVIITRAFILNKKLRMFIICYPPLILFMYFGYFQNVHAGLPFIFLIYLFWCLMNEETGTKTKFYLEFKVCLLFVLSVQIYWSGYSCIKEIFYDYSATKQVLNFIKDNNFDNNYKIMINTRWLSTQINQYFDKNIVYSYNFYSPEKLYDLHRQQSKEKNNNYIKEILALGKPDIYICSSSTAEKDFAKLKTELKLVKKIHSGWIFKDSVYDETTKIFVNPKKIQSLTIIDD